MIIERIIYYLGKQNKKMVDLCNYIGVNTSTATNWKKRNTDPPARYIIPICEFLEITPELLLKGDDPQYYKKPEQYAASDYSFRYQTSADLASAATHPSAIDPELLALISKLSPEKQIELRGYVKRTLEEITPAAEVS